MRLKQWGAVLMGCAALLLTACTVVDLDENGKPVLPADPNAKPSFDHLTPQQIAQQTWQSRVIDAANHMRWTRLRWKKCVRPLARRHRASLFA